MRQTVTIAAARLKHSRFGKRMRGEGAYADLFSRRFRIACRKLGLDDTAPLDCEQFRAPGRAVQLGLF